MHQLRGDFAPVSLTRGSHGNSHTWHTGTWARAPALAITVTQLLLLHVNYSSFVLTTLEGEVVSHVHHSSIIWHLRHGSVSFEAFWAVTDQRVRSFTPECETSCHSNDNDSLQCRRPPIVQLYSPHGPPCVPSSVTPHGRNRHIDHATDIHNNNNNNNSPASKKLVLW